MSEWTQADTPGEWTMRVGDIVATAWDRGEWNVYAAGAFERAYLAGGWAADDTLTGARRGAMNALREIGLSLLDAASEPSPEWDSGVIVAPG